LVTNWSLKLATIVLATKENWSLKISYIGFGYQNDLVSKLVYVTSRPNIIGLNNKIK